ncbi:nuclear transport factor 2 family protein [Streptomyces sp. NPDC026673]|uniref:nuclear transport factor 2 family protein n=1 Tax=Streptomyces sp. NPDC026673 TaxID=3155724 RepID=UPI0033C28BFC
MEWTPPIEIRVHNPRLITAITTAALLAVTGCSGDGNAGKAAATPAPPSTTVPAINGAAQGTAEDTAALEKAVRTYTTAYFAPDVDGGWAMWSTRCRKTDSKEGFADTLERAESMNFDHVRYTVERFSVDRLSGDIAVVTYGVGEDPRYDLTQQWAREDGEWRYDQCEPLD